MSINFLILLSFFSLEFLINFSFWSTCPSSLFSENVDHSYFNIPAWELQDLHHLESVSFFLKHFFLIFELLTLLACLRILKKCCVWKIIEIICAVLLPVIFVQREFTINLLCPWSRNRSPLPRLRLRWINAGFLCDFCH